MDAAWRGDLHLAGLSKEFKFTNPTTILEASLNEVLMLAKDENNSLLLLILSKFCT
ncbi:hypothetical protein YC2023_065688 [Brassica napus]